MKILILIQTLMAVLPSVANILSHYKDMVDSGRLEPKDKEQALVLLDELEWKDWDSV